MYGTLRVRLGLWKAGKSGQKSWNRETGPSDQVFFNTGCRTPAVSSKGSECTACKLGDTRTATLGHDAYGACCWLQSNKPYGPGHVVNSHFGSQGPILQLSCAVPRWRAVFVPHSRNLATRRPRRCCESGQKRLNVKAIRFLQKSDGGTGDLTIAACQNGPGA